MPPFLRYIPSVVSIRREAVPRLGNSFAPDIPAPGPPQRQVVSLPSGTLGTARTVGAMRKLILQGAKNPQIRELSADLAMRHSTDQGKIGSIFDFVQKKMKYVRDPVSQEMVAGAQYHYETLGVQGYARGDCDDHTVLLGSMLESVGYPTRITTARMRPGSGTDDHVYLEVHDRSGWIPLDASNKKRLAGEVPPAQRIRRWGK